MVPKPASEPEASNNFSDLFYTDEAMAGMMNSMLEESRSQMMAAVELTKLIVTDSSGIKNREDYVFTVFKNAMAVTAETSVLKNIIKQMEE